MTRTFSPTQMGKIIRQARELGLEATRIVLQPGGAIEIEVSGLNSEGQTDQEIEDEIARHFAKD